MSLNERGKEAEGGEAMTWQTIEGRTRTHEIGIYTLKKNQKLEMGWAAMAGNYTERLR